MKPAAPELCFGVIAHQVSFMDQSTFLSMTALDG